MSIAYIAFGSNLGDKEQNIKKALKLIGEKCTILKTSFFYKTEPVGFLNQDWFFNGVIKVRTKFTPLELLKFLKNIEKKLGRVKTVKNGPRIVDLDIIFYNNVVLSNKNLIIPHPNMHKRMFVLAPMCEIEPEFMHPVLQKSIAELMKMCHNLK